MKTKPCTRCHTDKPLTEFRRRADMARTYESACRDCKRKDDAARHARRRLDGLT